MGTHPAKPGFREVALGRFAAMRANGRRVRLSCTRPLDQDMDEWFEYEGEFERDELRTALAKLQELGVVRIASSGPGSITLAVCQSGNLQLRIVQEGQDRPVGLVVTLDMTASDLLSSL